MPFRKALISLAVISMAACGPSSREWQEVALPLPDDLPEVSYLRRPMPNLWVGTEQFRQLRIGEREPVEFPGQMGGRDTTNIYLRRDSTGAHLYFEEFGTYATVDLSTADVSVGTVDRDSVGTFIGAFVSPEIRDLRFVPASETRPADIGP